MFTADYFVKIKIFTNSENNKNSLGQISTTSAGTSKPCIQPTSLSQVHLPPSMSGHIERAYNWDDGYEQRYLAVNPLGDEVILYETNHEDPGVECNDMIKKYSQTDIEHIQCMSYMRLQVGWTGVGTMDGYVHIFDITKKEAPTLKLRSKQNRPCNSISFNDALLVAASFDKSRQDNSLQVWDILKHTRVFGEPEDDGRMLRPQHSYLSNEATLLTIFNHSDPSGMLLMAGGYKLLREFDLRELSGSPIYQVATKLTMNITLDPFQPHMFTLISEDGSVLIWDRRRLAGRGKGLLVTSELPVLHFSKLLADSLRHGSRPCFRYLSIRRGEFAAVLNGSLIRRWNTGTVPAMAELPEQTYFSGQDTVLLLKNQTVQLYDPAEELLFVAFVLDCKTDSARVVSFDYSPDTASPQLTNFVCMREKGLIFRMPVGESVDSIDFNSYNEFSIAGPEGTSTEFCNDRVLLEEPKQKDYYDDSADEESTEDKDFVPLRQMLDLLHVLQNDMCCVIKERALLGYATDPDKNIESLERLGGLGAPLSVRYTWKWLLLAKKSLDKGNMISEGIDLGYIGVLGVWRGTDELQDQQRLLVRGQKVTQDVFNTAVRAMVLNKKEKSAGISIFSTSEKNVQRKLCLIVSGWYLTEQEFDEKLNLLIEKGEIEKAAGWCVFYGDVPRAIEILASLKKERLQLMLTAVAGYMAYKDQNVNLPWNDQCRKLASELDNPYLRAIFAFIADNDWWDVLDEHALPLRERVGIALRFLSDKDLNLYLKRMTDTVVQRGELEGLILTGLTPRGIDLLQLYVDRTSDVQTACLMAQFAVPRYFRDRRVDHWIDCYRDLLNLWGLFKIRARFDVARTKLLKTHFGNVTMRPAPRQVYLQCPRCNKNMATSGEKALKNTSLMKQFTRMNVNSAHLDHTVCPHCSLPLPRCAICLLTLGTPIPHLQEDDSIRKTFSSKMSFCLSCNHGYHALHAEEWFRKHYVCPVPDCNCRCNSK